MSAFLQMLGFLCRQLFVDFPAPTGPTLTGRTVLVTGARAGLGLETALHFARLGPARIILGVREESTAAGAVETLKNSGFTGSIEVWATDLENFSSVKKFGERVRSLDRLDIAVLNAGLATMNFALTTDGWERVLQVNVLSTGLMALYCIPLLQRTAESSGEFKPHLCIVSSEAHMMSNFSHRNAPVLFDAYNDKANFDRFDTYNVSKLLEVYAGRQLATLPSLSTITVTTVNPGFAMSDLRREVSGMFIIRLLESIFAWSGEKGARNIAYAALASVPSGSYISECKVTKPGRFVVGKEASTLQTRVWDELVQFWAKIDADAVAFVRS